MSDAHLQMEKIYEEMHSRVKELNSASQNWTLEMEKVKVNPIYLSIRFKMKKEMKQGKFMTITMRN